MDHDEIRKYRGWHHHMLACMLAHCFLWHLKIRLGKNSPGAYGVAAEDVAGNGPTVKNVHDCSGAMVGRKGAAEKPPGIPVAPKTVFRRAISQVAL